VRRFYARQFQAFAASDSWEITQLGRRAEDFFDLVMVSAKGSPTEIASCSGKDTGGAVSASATLAVSLGQMRTLIEEPYSTTHSAMPPEVKHARGLEPGGIRLSIGLEDWHDIIHDLGTALEQI
jgi:Cys/Met metabolism PLP-dependent enzyme